eukprot:4363480-Prymnesium_polylepis.1
MLVAPAQRLGGARPRCPTSPDNMLPRASHGARPVTADPPRLPRATVGPASAHSSDVCLPRVAQRVAYSSRNEPKHFLAKM